VGSPACIACHEKQHPQLTGAWRASRHRTTRIAPSGRWEDDEVFPPHDVIVAQGTQVDAARQCLGCHVTGYFVSSGQFAEPGVGCEACHGPGKLHVGSKGGKANIVNPAGLPLPRANMVCGQCHSLGRDLSGVHPFPVMREGEATGPFRPGHDLTTAFVDAEPKVARKGWEYSTFVRSSARYAAQRCTDCHDPHGRPGHPAMLKDPTSETCLRCHGVGRARLRYQNHASLGDVTRKPCWTCHRDAHSH